jgi:hypothetical protein
MLGAAGLHREGDGSRGLVRLWVMDGGVGNMMCGLVLHLRWCSGLYCAGSCRCWRLGLGVGAYMGVGIDWFALWGRHFEVLL